MSKPPSINRKRITSHKNAAVRKNINDLNRLNSPETARRTDDEETYKKARPAYQRN